MGYRQMVRQLVLIQSCTGSSPVSPVSIRILRVDTFLRLRTHHPI